MQHLDPWFLSNKRVCGWPTDECITIPLVPTASKSSLQNNKPPPVQIIWQKLLCCRIAPGGMWQGVQTKFLIKDLCVGGSVCHSDHSPSLAPQPPLCLHDGPRHTDAGHGML